MRTIVTTAQACAVLVGAAAATHLPVSPSQVLLVVLMAAAALLPLLARRGGSLARALACVGHRRPTVWQAPAVRDVTVPPAPGTPGTTLARAPSRGARAIA